MLELAGDEPAEVLEVGCGDGFLSASVTDRGRGVVGLDADAPVLERARARWPEMAVDWRLGDLMAADLPLGAFDAVLSNATLHHLQDTGAALDRLGDLVRPGGVLRVVGFARNSWWDWPYALAGQAVLIAVNRVHRKWEHRAPQHWPPPLTHDQVRQVAAERLPGSRFRRLVFVRYLLTWRRPK
ncbi:class I SAM-dependent methyltransferase [Naumannella sp. ID2617S]|nr:class I SAM-dependent methyltransferase [Naumannella sp. ID2617S]